MIRRRPWLEVRMSEAAPHNIANALWTRERHQRSLRPQQHPLRRPNATVQTQIMRN